MSAKLVRVKNAPGIYRRGSRYAVKYRDNQGRPRQRSAATLAQARDLKASLQTDIARGEYQQLSRLTLAQYTPEFLAHYQGRTRTGIREHTLLAYAHQLGYTRTPAGDWIPLEPPQGAIASLGSLRLSEIEAFHLKRYAAQVAARGVSANTVRLALAPLKILLATAVEERLLRHHPAAGLRLTAGLTTTQPDETTPKALTLPQLRALIAAAPPHTQLLISFLFHTGLRISEALALTWNDIDDHNQLLQIRRRLYKGTLAPPKSPHSRRDLPISPALQNTLHEIRDQPGYTNGRHAPILQAKNGRPLDRHHAFKQIKTAATKIGLPWVGLHTLRHTCATTLFNQGANPKQVQGFLGHHSAAFTLNTYIHQTPDNLPTPALDDSSTQAASVRPRRHLELIQSPGDKNHRQQAVHASRVQPFGDSSHRRPLL